MVRSGLASTILGLVQRGREGEKERRKRRRRSKEAQKRRGEEKRVEFTHIKHKSTVL